MTSEQKERARKAVAKWNETQEHLQTVGVKEICTPYEYMRPFVGMTTSRAWIGPDGLAYISVDHKTVYLSRVVVPGSDFNAFAGAIY